ncbi:MAG: FAD-dependent oxidoreductase, partial [Candidatus Dormiibacterota bacterium]
VALLGHYLGTDGPKMRFADDVAQSVAFGDARMRDFWGYVQVYCKSVGRLSPDFDWPEPFTAGTPTELDLRQAGVGTVIWTSGYRPDYRWVKAPVFDEMGFPIQVAGRTNVAGLYFVGVHWLTNNSSSILYGVGEDAKVVARQIAGDRP